MRRYGADKRRWEENQKRAPKRGVVVPEVGLEPTRGVTALDFESSMTANSITPARKTYCTTVIMV